MKKSFKLIYVLLIGLTISGGVSITSYADDPLTAYDSGEVSPQSDIIEWRYKIENGKSYKRLFNYTKNEWIGEWILMS